VPTYQYACTSCAEQVEKVQRFSDDPLTVCPACGGALRKVFSPVGIVFKGSGFYRTDSRKASVATADDKGAKDGKPKGSDGNSSEKNGSSPDSGSASSGGSGGSASSDTKKSADTKSSQPAKAGSST
jgi:putative FmdB family regulatory protein